MPTVVLGLGDPRPWEQKWRDVLDELQRMERACAREEGQSTDDVRRAVEGFFKTCRELADWLWQNGGLAKPIVMSFVLSDPRLRLADAVAQTTKHHTRTGDDPITARITEIRSAPEGISAKISWSRPSGTSGAEDALDLARKCVQSWQGFLGL
jgi:hypothetical protein